MKYFTMILKVPDDWKPGPELTENPYFTAGSWSHVIDDRDIARAEAKQLREQLEGDMKHGT
jgi:hypothetical protein